jgi:uncharacterized repeat protein (TIGR03847 family)
MSESYDFSELDFLTVGTLGPKGQREFYLQARGDGRLVSLKIEKQQVTALADYLDRILDQLPDVEPGRVPDDLDMREPVVAAWSVGSIGIAYAEDRDQLIVMAEEFSDADDEGDAAHARFALSREQVAGLVERARHLVAAGRAPCPYCGQPLEPRNHDWCPCRN